MSNWKAYRQLNVEVTFEQHEKLQSMFRALEGGGRINTTATAETGPIVVSAALIERDHRVPVYTNRIIKASWEDEFGIQWQAWLEADGEVVKVYSFMESHLELEDGIDGRWVEQAGRCAEFNRMKAGA